MQDLYHQQQLEACSIPKIMEPGPCEIEAQEGARYQTRQTHSATHTSVLTQMITQTQTERELVPITIIIVIIIVVIMITIFHCYFIVF